MLPTDSRRRSGALAACLWLVFAACDNPAGPTPPGLPAPPDVRPWVTGNAADAVDSRGHFELPGPGAPGSASIIFPNEALDLGSAFVRTWLWEESGIIFPGTVSVHHIIQEAHGGPIPWRRLEPVRAKLYFAESPYEPLPEDVPVWARRLAGPVYLVPLAADGVLVASLAIAAYATDLSIGSDGMVRLPRISGHEFSLTAIPLSDQRPIPVWPEEAVRLVATATGARVTEVPRLVTIHRHYSPHFARWALKLDRAVPLRNTETGKELQSSTVYVGLWKGDLAWFVPQDTQPTAEDLPYLVDQAIHTITLRFRPDVPVTYDLVEPR